jgi:hypothetical protein
VKPGLNPVSDNPSLIVAGVLETLRASVTLLLDPSPSSIDRCRNAVAQCVGKIAKLIESDRTGCDNRELRTALLLVRGELRAIQGLLDSAAAFKRNMLKAIAQATPATVFQPGAFQATVQAIDAAPKKAGCVHVLG